MAWWEAVLGLVAVATLARLLVHDHEYVEVAGREYCAWCGKMRKD